MPNVVGHVPVGTRQHAVVLHGQEGTPSAYYTLHLGATGKGACIMGPHKSLDALLASMRQERGPWAGATFVPVPATRTTSRVLGYVRLGFTRKRHVVVETPSGLVTMREGSHDGPLLAGPVRSVKALMSHVTGCDNKGWRTAVFEPAEGGDS